MSSSLIQNVLANTRAVSPPAREYASGGGEVWFELELIDQTVSENPFAQVFAVEQMPRLLPGNSYVVRVSATRCHMNWRPVDTSRQIQVVLCCEVPGIGITDAKRLVEKDEIATFEEEFELTVPPAECPSGEFELRVVWVAEGRRAVNVAASLRFRLDGTYYPPDAGLMESCRISLNATPPPNTAILHIVQEQNRYRLRGWSSKIDRLETEPIEPPTIALAELLKELDAKTVKNTLSSASRRNSEDLLKWFDGLSKSYGDQLSLIIADHSMSELPWEMIEIQAGRYLGAYWRVVRWIPVRDFLAWQDLNLGEEERCGEVLAYLNDKELKVAVERKALDQFSTSYCETTNVLENRFSEPLHGVAMVYLGCHGIFSYNEKHKTALGELGNPSNTVVPLSIEAIEGQKGLRPLLFVNACHSARLIRDSNGFYGLPEVFLARIASAYLGTLGPVGSRHASEIAEFVLTEAAQNKIEPAEILRALRARAVKRLAGKPTADDLLNFIHTFMYVYYGNPFTRIELMSAGGREGDA